MSQLSIEKYSNPHKIGLCHRGGHGACRDKHAFIEFANGERLVSTISFYTGDGLTIGEYYEGRIEDLNYFVRSKDSRTLTTEFEKWDDEIHAEDYTGEYGVETV